MPDAALTTLPPVDAHRQAEILAMRQLSDNLAQLNKSVATLAGDMREVRDRVLRIEAQELKVAIGEVRADVVREIGGLRRDLAREIEAVRRDHDSRLSGLESRTGEHATSIARLKGMVIPLASIGSALGAGLLAFVSQLVANLLAGPFSHRS
jgi:hypothetical protein